MQTPTLFLCDTDRSFLEALQASESENLRVVTASTRVQAQLALADPNQQFSVIALSTNVCDPYSIPLVRFSKSHRPATPVCLLGESADSIPDLENLRAIHIQQTIIKPVEPSALIQSLFPSAYFDKDKALALAAANEARPGEEAQLDDGGMHPILAESFLCGKKSFFDVYVLLRPGKYVMILKAGDDFDFERVASYLQKGVKYFYIRKEAQQLFLNYCDKLTDALLKNKTVSAEKKQQQVQNFGKETLDHLKNCGVSETSLMSASRFGQYAHQLVTQHDFKKSKAIQEFLANMEQCEHGTGTAMILALMLEAMEYKDEKVVSVVAMGGLLHDLALLQMPPHFLDEEFAEFTPEERAKYEQHPVLASEILAKVPNVPPLLPQVVLQHHERRDRKGFPSKLGPGQISPVSEMIGIAETFNTLIKQAAKDSGIDPLREMRLHFYDKFSFPVVAGFKKALGVEEE